MKKFFFCINNKSKYPISPYSPPKDYPEFKSLIKDFDESNMVFDDIRKLFISAKYDIENIGTSMWNPFRGFIKNNQSVFIKPNLVMEEKNNLLGSNCITTHASVIRPILDYLLLLQRIDNLKFRIIIGDVPLQSANFAKIVQQTGLKSLVEYYKTKYEFDIELLDLRNEIIIVEDGGFIKEKIKVNNDPLGYTNIHLNESFLDEIINDSKKFSVGSYSDEETSKRHAQLNNHYYQIPNTILSSDLFINVPKIKTHQKAGITVALKNLIGISSDKSWIPHYRKGSPKFNGDEFSDEKYLLKYINRYIAKLLQNRSQLFWNFSKIINKKIIKPIFFKDQKPRYIDKRFSKGRKIECLMSGAWCGNNTIWRPILDLNNCLLYLDKSGKIKDIIQRKYLCISDGIIGAEGNGPLDPVPKNLGLIAISINPVVNDLCCAAIMGFDWMKIPLLKNSIYLRDYFKFAGDLEDISIVGFINDGEYINYTYENLPNYQFIPPPGWMGQIERHSSVISSSGKDRRTFPILQQTSKKKVEI